jgi:hypothetical protein
LKHYTDHFFDVFFPVRVRQQPLPCFFRDPWQHVLFHRGPHLPTLVLFLHGHVLAVCNPVPFLVNAYPTLFGFQPCLCPLFLVGFLVQFDVVQSFAFHAPCQFLFVQKKSILVVHLLRFFPFLLPKQPPHVVQFTIFDLFQNKYFQPPKPMLHNAAIVVGHCQGPLPLFLHDIGPPHKGSGQMNALVKDVRHLVQFQHFVPPQPLRDAVETMEQNGQPFLIGERGGRGVKMAVPFHFLGHVVTMPQRSTPVMVFHAQHFGPQLHLKVVFFAPTPETRFDFVESVLEVDGLVLNGHVQANERVLGPN